MRVLIACEESQTVCKAFRAEGIEAYSCDILDCSGGFPEYHIKGDVISLLDGKCKFETISGNVVEIPERWDIIIAHPPCTYLSVTGSRWFNIERYGEAAKVRAMFRDEAISFFLQIARAKCEHIAIENPVGVMSTRWRKPDQIIQPYQFGDPYEKRTCLWLKGLPKLKSTKVVQPEERQYFASGRSMPRWYSECWSLSKEERRRVRSKTFPGIADAMAKQWGKGLDKYTDFLYNIIK